MVAIPPTPASAAGGGASFDPRTAKPAPREPSRSTPFPKSGGARFRQRVRKPAGAPRLRYFRLSRSSLFLYGRSARVRFRIDSRAARVRVTLVVRRRGSRRIGRRIALGRFRTRRAQSASLVLRSLPEGRYMLGIRARDSRGHRLRRARTARGRRARATRDFGVHGHRFPLRGPFSYSGPDGRFGADRGERTHQGQDLPAASGTPIVAPRGGRIKQAGYSAAGAGNYAVLDGAGEDRDYVFMHMRTGSRRVRTGQRVVTGQRIGDVGNTGHSFGAHLHLETWVGGGWYSGGHAVDPLPSLRRWDRWS